MQKYLDKWGELWEKINDWQVRRISDGNLGGWQNGNGLTLVE